MKTNIIFIIVLAIVFISALYFMLPNLFSTSREGLNFHRAIDMATILADPTLKNSTKVGIINKIGIFIIKKLLF